LARIAGALAIFAWNPMIPAVSSRTGGTRDIAIDVERCSAAGKTSKSTIVRATIVDHGPALKSHLALGPRPDIDR